MQMRITHRLPKIYYMWLLIGHNTLYSEFLSYISPSHASNTLILRTLLWDYVVRRKLKIKDMTQILWISAQSPKHCDPVLSSPASWSSSKLSTSRCLCYFPVSTAWKVKGRLLVNLMWDITHDNAPPHYALLCHVGGKGLTWKLSVGISQQSREHCFGNAHMGW